VGVAAVGCGGARIHPHTLSPVGAVPAVTPTATDSRPPPLSPRQQERTAVVAAVRRYYTITNRLHREMDASALAALFTASCACQAQVVAVRTAARQKEHYIDHAHLNRLVPTLHGSRQADVLVDLNAARGGLVTSAGRVVTSAPPARHVERVFRLERVHARWLIYRIETA
jgi:hypothetical protein